MNKIYLSGIVSETPVRHMREGSPEHICFHLCVSHKTKQSVVKHELYPVHAWNDVAAWATGQLRQGQRVLVQGYLTQRTITGADGQNRTFCEVTAEEFFPAAAIREAEQSRLQGRLKQATEREEERQ